MTWTTAHLAVGHGVSMSALLLLLTVFTMVH